MVRPERSAGCCEMSLRRQSLFRREGLEIRRVACRPSAPEPGAIEYGERSTLVLPTAGLFRFHLGAERTFLVDATQALFLPRGEAHRFSHPRAGGDDCLAIDLPPDRLTSLLDDLDPAAADRSEPPYAAHRVVLPPQSLLARRLLEHRLASGRASLLEVDETLIELVASWVRARPARRLARPARTETARSHRERVEAVQLHLASDLTRSWRLDELARQVATSACHLTTLFRRAIGVPIHRYLLRLRLARALDEVTGSRRDLTAIGADLGFSTPSHFAAAFRRAFGQAPSELRRRVEPHVTRNRERT